MRCKYCQRYIEDDDRPIKRGSRVYCSIACANDDAARLSS